METDEHLRHSSPQVTSLQQVAMQQDYLHSKLKWLASQRQSNTGTENRNSCLPDLRLQLSVLVSGKGFPHKTMPGNRTVNVLQG